MKMGKNRASVTAAVIAKDAERHLRDCLMSLRWADEVLVVVDATSTDGTLELAREFADRVEISTFINYSQQRNVALRLATCDWVLFVDADERCGDELRHEVEVLLSEVTSPYTGYWIPRRNIFFGYWVRHSGWYPDYQLRLLRREHAHYDERRAVHELAQLDGPTDHLKCTLTHYNYDSLHHFTSKQARYALAEAQTMHSNGVRPRWRNYVLQPLREFNRRFITWRGYRDGWMGLVLATLMAYYHFVTYMHLRRLWQDNNTSSGHNQPEQAQETAREA